MTLPKICRKCFENWINRWHACIGTHELILKAVIKIYIKIRENVIFYFSIGVKFDHMVQHCSDRGWNHMSQAQLVIIKTFVKLDCCKIKICYDRMTSSVLTQTSQQSTPVQYFKHIICYEYILAFLTKYFCIKQINFIPASATHHHQLS